MKHAAQHGVDVIAGDPRPVFGWDAARYDLGYLAHVRELADAQRVQIEPYVGSLFGLSGPSARTARRAVLASIRAAKILGGPYVRTGYGQLEIQTSRFNPDIRIREHLAFLIASLREASELATSEGVVVAVENHVDFTGRELAHVLDCVDSPAIRAALDTGNSFAVFSDSADDIRTLAPWAVMCHLKDMRVVAHGDSDQVPFIPVGCALGEGQVDIAEAIRLLFEKGPRGNEIPLVVETGWVRPGDGASSEEILMRSVEYVRKLVVTDEGIRGLLNVAESR
jgi:sugar phosphate isomerase/epimerase